MCVTPFGDGIGITHENISQQEKAKKPISRVGRFLSRAMLLLKTEMNVQNTKTMDDDHR
jgi:hypothetical protein